ncbi:MULTISPECIES: hypothetical protein [Campylobacter]|uniref:Uncharacterized protein n=1 Tax=Campylobacter porcelli TaxID=1660073 RepID=A0A1X9SV33_9BACT|nr:MULTISPECIES: hypothetical protein [unclassified Campylobacter]MCR8679180.1 hypothetical protein [Campylobacter sp. RM19072]MCR8696686.1 hypothetical protein [Campylobacter sp. RM19073]MEE3744793.1 hypothetical protein [Campylobacter sp. CX2-4855-23]MEE3777116.1 hypothetical protein [Campylobacter sp. CX2-4080-23]ARR00122.1 hypothetical protein CSUIS_0281 [Campylobacter sp. RM6137]
MRQITLTVASKDYNITLDDEFADYFEADIKQLLDDKHQLAIKDLLTAFVKKCHENYEQKSELSSILGNINKALTNDKSI